MILRDALSTVLISVRQRQHTVYLIVSIWSSQVIVVILEVVAPANQNVLEDAYTTIPVLYVMTWNVTNVLTS